MDAVNGATEYGRTEVAKSIPLRAQLGIHRDYVIIDRPVIELLDFMLERRSIVVGSLEEIEGEIG